MQQIFNSAGGTGLGNVNTGDATSGGELVITEFMPGYGGCPANIQTGPDANGNYGYGPNPNNCSVASSQLYYIQAQIVCDLPQEQGLVFTDPEHATHTDIFSPNVAGIYTP